MKLEPECVRALLLTLEEIIIVNDHLFPPNLSIEKVCEHELMKGFSKGQIAYTTLRLKEANFINVIIDDYINGFNVTYDSLTYTGHEFLEGVRENKNWKTIKTLASKIGMASLSVIKAISEGVAAAAINKLIDLNVATSAIK